MLFVPDDNAINTHLLKLGRNSDVFVPFRLIVSQSGRSTEAQY